MKILDISIPIRPEMVVWPGDPQVQINKLSSIKKGDHSNLSQISMSLHTGTHIDSPKHFLENGKTIDQIPLEKLIGKVLVIAINENVRVIDKSVLLSHPMVTDLKKSKKVLFRTRNASHYDMKQGKFSEEYVGINQSGAQFLAECNLDLIGVDYLSVASFNDTEAPHKILLDKEIVLLEGINLKEVSPGFYDLYCLPLPISGSDGAPARAILIEQN